ncbi:MAG: hypothetical protein DCC71_21770 [Proteobacteria bacterium]|nr:MAG: hypothetical protein DCC71_21770 [Pseudomonadota bacterium]
MRTPLRRWSAAHVVLASGAWAGAAIDSAPPLPIRPVRGQLASLRGPALPSIVWDDAIYLVPRADGGVTAGATVEDVGFECRVTSDGVRSLLARAAQLVPALAEAAFEGARAGLRPATPDGLPLVGPAPDAPGLLLALGHHRNGILLSATTAALVADLVLGRALPAAARAFRPDRFAIPAAGAAAR